MIQNLRKFLKDIADAIRAKEGSTEKINPQDFATKIKNFKNGTGHLRGVFIQHIDGSLHTIDEWSKHGYTNDEANGVALCELNARFVIAKTEIEESMLASDTTNLLESVDTRNYYMAPKTDYDGVGNTEGMLKVDVSGAAYLCDNYIFQNGSKGYLPACGELDLIVTNSQIINEAMELIGGTTYYGCY
jgi:hypothetical protein